MTSESQLEATEHRARVPRRAGSDRTGLGTGEAEVSRTGYALAMSEISDFNQQIIEEFRANDGVVGGPLQGLPLLLLHHTGAKSGIERVNPLAYQRIDDDSVADLRVQRWSADEPGLVPQPRRQPEREHRDRN